MAMNQRAVVKLIEAFKQEFPEQLLWAVPADILIDFATESMRQEQDGLVAATRFGLHFFRKSRFAKVHETFPKRELGDIEQVTAGFSNGNVEVLVLTRVAGIHPWGIVVDGEDRRQFLLERLETWWRSPAG